LSWLVSQDKGIAHTGDTGIGRKTKHESIWCPCSGRTNTETLKWQRLTWEGDQEPV
jgi:hypothetical protein